jgi:hypothetical protein
MKRMFNMEIEKEIIIPIRCKNCLQDFITCGYYDDTDEEFGGLSDCIGYIQEKQEKEYKGIDKI